MPVKITGNLLQHDDDGAGDTTNITLTADGIPSCATTATSDNHLTNKSYVDSKIVGLTAKNSVRAATTADGTLASSFAAGQAIDGITLAADDRILIKNQAAAAENGIYTVNSSGAPTRATDFDADADVANGAFTFVQEGSSQGDTGWMMTTDGSITVGTTALAFSQFSANTLANGAVTTAKLAADAVTGAKIADDAIDSDHIADGAIDTAHIADSQITLAKMAANSVDSDQYVDGSIDTAHLAADAVTGAKIADDAIDSEHIADGAIDTAHIAASQITLAKMAANSVDSDQYVDGSIDTAHLAADAVTGAKIADNAIDSEHYVDGSIDTAHLAADAVDGTKIADNAIDSEHYVDGSIDAAHLADLAVTDAKLNSNAVIEAKIASNAVTESKISNDAVSTNKLADNAVTTAKIGTLTQLSIDPNHSNNVAGLNISNSSTQHADSDLVSIEGQHQKVALAVQNGQVNLNTSSGNSIQAGEGLLVVAPDGQANDSAAILVNGITGQAAIAAANGSLLAALSTDGTPKNITISHNGTHGLINTSNGSVSFDTNEVHIGNGKLTINNTAVNSTATELNILDGVTATTAELNILDGVTSTAAELNILDGVTANASELNILDGVTSSTAELNILDGVTANASELNILDGVTSSTAELNILDGVTSTAAELNILDGNTAATSTTLADADRLVVNDDGTMVQVALTDLETYLESALDTLSNVTTVGALNAGSITSGFGSIDVGSSTISTTAAVTGGSFNTTSDISLKTNISEIENSLEKVNKIRGVNFTWKEDNREDFGVIAQEVEEVAPHAVQEGSDGYKKVDYSKLTTLLIQAVKEQQKLIEEQRKDIDLLKEKVNSV